MTLLFICISVLLPKNEIIMKKLLLKLFLITIALITVSCSDDDAPVTNQSIEEAILGKWYPNGGTINGGEFIEYTGDDCQEYGDYQEFTAEGQLLFVGYNEQCEVSETNSSAYTISGNKLTVEGINGLSDMDYTILTLTSQQLILESTYNTPEGTVTEVAYFGRN